ncbi:MAG: hypothetical protein WAV82_05985, partial [Methylobacter sp.]
TIENMPVSPGSILITGHFVKVDEANHIRRTVTRLGMCQSSLDTELHLLAPEPADMGKRRLLTQTPQ